MINNTIHPPYLGGHDCSSHSGMLLDPPSHLVYDYGYDDLIDHDFAARPWMQCSMASATSQPPLCYISATCVKFGMIVYPQSSLQVWDDRV